MRHGCLVNESAYMLATRDLCNTSGTCEGFLVMQYLGTTDRREPTAGIPQAVVAGVGVQARRRGAGGDVVAAAVGAGSGGCCLHPLCAIVVDDVSETALASRIS